MPTVVADLVARLRGDTSQFNSAMRSAQGTTATTTSRIGSSMATLAKSIGIGFGIYQITRFVGGAIKEAEEAEKAARQTAAVLKSTGGIAGVTAGHIGKLSDRLAILAGTDDEAIQAMNNWLLTFKNIRNVGADKIFDRTSKAAVDLAARIASKTGGSTVDSLAGASTMLGKALNDPIRGMTALQKAGVQLSDSQRNVIRAFVESGDLISAQKIILAEVESQAKGAAAANVTASERMRVAWEQLKEMVGKLLLPVLERLVPVFQNIITWVMQNKAAFEAFGRGVISVFSALGNAVRFVFSNIIVPVFQGIRTGIVAVGMVFSAVKNGIVAAWNAVGSAIGWVWRNVIRPPLNAMMAAFNAVKAAVNAVKSAIGGVWGGPNGLGASGPSFKTPGKQFGGPVTGQRPYIVGEAGPELFVPNSSGSVVPNHKLGGMGGGLAITINVGGSVVSERQLVDVVREGLRRGSRQGQGTI